jgi:hypothetical protein
MTSEFMIRVSWATNKHTDGQPDHTRRGEVMFDLGLPFSAGDDFTSEEMQAIAYETKMAALKILRRRKRSATSARNRGSRSPARRG